MGKIDAAQLVSWLDESEEEAKAKLVKNLTRDPYIEGVLSTVRLFREYVTKMERIENAAERLIAHERK